MNSHRGWFTKGWFIEKSPLGDDGSLTSHFNFNPIDFDGYWGAINPDWSQSSISIYLNVDEPTLLAVDSRVVDKITIESNAIKPSAWEISYDWFGQLS